jgi:hypothetical protein
MVCPELKQTGRCSTRDTRRYSHFLKFCHLCNAQLLTPNTFHQHYSGKRHAARLYHAGDGEGGICRCCSVAYGPPYTLATFSIHCKSSPHSKLAAQSQEDDNVQRDPKNIPKGTVLCTMCNIAIAENSFNPHLCSKRHLSAISFHNSTASFSRGNGLAFAGDMLLLTIRTQKSTFSGSIWK